MQTHHFPPTSTRVPDTPECFPWAGGAVDTLQNIFNAIDEVADNSVIVTRTGDETATSAFGYTYDIAFAGADVRGDMDLRCVVRDVFVRPFSC